jgi:hypothetical protein
MGLYAALAFVAFVVAVAGHEVWRRWVRRRFLRARQLLGDAAFCEAVAAPVQEAPWWVELRRALAEQCGLSAEAILPEDKLDTLEAMTFDGWDFHDLHFTLMERLNIPTSRLVEEDAGAGEWPTTVRGVGQALARVLRAVVPPGETTCGRTE